MSRHLIIIRLFSRFRPFVGFYYTVLIYFSGKMGTTQKTGSSPKVNTNSGKVEGFRIQTKKGPIDVFLGIPYAEPPLGKLRFQVSHLICVQYLHSI